MSGSGAARLRRWALPGLLGTAWLAWAAFGLATLPAVPFHPDEATHIYLSADFDQLVLRRDPAGVSWDAPGAAPDVRRYRLLEAPLSRYLIGLSRALLGGAATSVDWNWSADWDANIAAGALPNARLLRVARLPAAALTLLVPLLLFDLGRRLDSRLAGAVAAVLFALSGPALLHGRRAMSEGPLLFCSVLAVWLAVWAASRVASSPPATSRAWLRPLPIAAALGAAAALAAAAKLTGWAVLPVAALAALPGPAPRRGLRLAVVLLSAGLVAWAINPAMWSRPAAGLHAMAAARADLLRQQAQALGEAAPGRLLNGPVEHLAAQVYHTYLAPLAFWDIPNYAAQTAAAEAAYQAQPLHVGLRLSAPGPRLAAGAVLLGLGLAGVGFAVLGAVRGYRAGSRAGLWPLVLFVAWTAATTAGLFTLNLAWQRYYLPLLPIACLWAGLGAAALARPLGRVRPSPPRGSAGGRPPAETAAAPSTAAPPESGTAD
jgi:hypothetical protein